MDILRLEFPDPVWTTIQTEHDILHAFSAHEHKLFSDLQRITSRKCKLCAFVHDQLASTKVIEPRASSPYHIFVKPRHDRVSRFYICLDDVARFAQPERLVRDLNKIELRLFGRLLNQPIDDSNIAQLKGLSSQPSPRTFYLSLLADNDLGSDQTFTQAKSWQRECDSNHVNCRPPSQLLPKRLLDLSWLVSRSVVRLYLTSPGETGDYATLSYTWGASQYVRLKTQNRNKEHPERSLANRCKGIRADDFPQTLLDALCIAQRLGFRFIWVDSLCIIQDDKQDWAEQSVAMTTIYEYARLNISATRSENTVSGIFGRTPRKDIRLGTVMTSAPLSVATCTQREEHETNGQLVDVCVSLPSKTLDLEEEYLARRGWVFQERLVSGATLHYTSQGITWECRHGSRVQNMQGHTATTWKAQWKTFTDAIAHDRSSLAELCLPKSASQKIILHNWNQWIAAYAERELYDPRDRLTAIAGIAGTLARGLGLVYKAGLWQEDFLRGLTWKRFDRTPKLQRFDGDNTPSWSWASVQGKLVFADTEPTDSLAGPLLDILEPAEVVEDVPGHFGHVTYGWVMVKGLIQQVVVDKRLRPGLRKEDGQPIGVKAGFMESANVFVMLDDPFQSYVKCWCLRIVSYYDDDDDDDDGCRVDAFLLLEEVEEIVGVYKRIGLVETRPWHGVAANGSGLLQSPESKICILV